MNNPENKPLKSIFEKYPPQIGDFDERLMHASNSAPNPRERLDAVDAIVGAEIHRIGYVLGGIATGVTVGILGHEVGNDVIQTAGTVVGVISGLGAFTIGRIDNGIVSNSHSKVRRPDNFFRLLFSKKWYESARNKEYARRAGE